MLIVLNGKNNSYDSHRLTEGTGSRDDGEFQCQFWVEGPTQIDYKHKLSGGTCSRDDVNFNVNFVNWLVKSIVACATQTCLLKFCTYKWISIY
jgi:hypothetical protein